MSNSLGRRALVGLVVGATALGGFAAGALGAPVKGGTITDAEDQSPPILNNLLADGATVVGARLTVGNIFQNMFTANASGKYAPVLSAGAPSAKDVVIKNGKMIVTLHIQPKAAWSDGKPLTANDIIFTWKTMINPKNQVASKTGWDLITSIKARGNKTAVVTFKKPYAPWKDVFCTCGGYFLLPQHVLQGKDFNTFFNTGNLIGSGPYVLSAYKPDESATLVPNPRYWDAAKSKGPNVSQIVFKLGLGTTTQAVQLKSGEANLINPPPTIDLVNSIAADNPDAVVQSKPAATFEHLAVNTQVAPLNDVKVRQALAYSLDRAGMVANLLKGAGVGTLQSSLVPFQLGYKPTFARYTYNPAKAQQILKADGWTLGGDGIFTKGGQKLSLTIKTTSGNTQRANNIQFLAARAKAAGFDLNLVTEPASKLFGGTLTNGDYQLANYAFSGSADPSQTSIFRSDAIPTQANGFAGQNVYRIADKTLDKLLAASDGAIDQKTRAKILGQEQDRLANLVPFIPIYQRPNILAAKKVIVGPQENPTQAEAYWNSASWYVTTGKS